MNRTSDFSKIETVHRRLAALLEEHPNLASTTRRLSTETLTQYLLDAHSELVSGVPVHPPDEFVRDTWESISEQEWQTLMEELNEWKLSLEPPVNGALSPEDLRLLAVGLLWETVLISEFAQRREH